MRKWYSKITNVHNNEFENDKRRKSNNEKKTSEDHAAKLIDGIERHLTYSSQID